MKQGYSSSLSRTKTISKAQSRRASQTDAEYASQLQKRIDDFYDKNYGNINPEIDYNWKAFKGQKIRGPKNTLLRKSKLPKLKNGTQIATYKIEKVLKKLSERTKSSAVVLVTDQQTKVKKVLKIYNREGTKTLLREARNN